MYVYVKKNICKDTQQRVYQEGMIYILPNSESTHCRLMVFISLTGLFCTDRWTSLYFCVRSVGHTVQTLCFSSAIDDLFVWRDGWQQHWPSIYPSSYLINSVWGPQWPTLHLGFVLWPREQTCNATYPCMQEFFGIRLHVNRFCFSSKTIFETLSRWNGPSDGIRACEDTMMQNASPGWPTQLVQGSWIVVAFSK